MKNIFAISGSTRTNSSNWKILELISDKFKGQINVEIYKELDKLPFFNPNLKIEVEVPFLVKDFYEKINHADGIIICTPEYVFSPPAILKNALEWTVAETIFSFKPVALIVAAGSGEKTLESLDLILKTLIQEEIPESSKLLIKGIRGKINQNGNFSDEKVCSDIISVVNSLIKTIEQKTTTTT